MSLVSHLPAVARVGPGCNRAQTFLCLEAMVGRCSELTKGGSAVRSVASLTGSGSKL